MVCDRCILTVRAILERNNISYKTIRLGTVEFQKPVNLIETDNLQNEFKKVGFEIISEKNQRVVKQIKAIILKEIFQVELQNNQNLSVTLSEQLHFDYSHLSSIFSKTEGKSIQTYQNELKVERIKELLEYNELSISEIADKLGFGSAAYLSTQFKKISGTTPSQYKNSKKDRNALDTF